MAIVLGRFIESLFCFIGLQLMPLLLFKHSVERAILDQRFIQV